MTAPPPAILQFLDGTVERRPSAAIGMATIEDNEVAWTAAAGKGADAVFQAGSLSKTVTAAVALELVGRGVLELDADVSAHLSSWSLPPGSEATLRSLLGHTAGVNVPFCPGYPQGAPAPTLAQSLRGAKPATTPAVTVDPKRAGHFRYSGAGYAIVQQLLEDATGKPFAEIARRTVFDPLGMPQSSFAQPPEPMPAPPAWDDWRFYPEQAAAGLWTTPSDLARFVCAIQGGGAGLAQETVAAMTTPQAGLPFGGQWTVVRALGLAFPRRAGLGLFVDAHRFINLGGASGSFSALTGSTGDGSGAVVMTAGCRSPRAIRILLEVADAQGWSDLRLSRRGPRRWVSDRLLRLLS
ncbi:MAG TPA: serine hydrolase domain-containing protein [Gaiellaceae bacterium]|nr:serine hydrolase domain-containing protein [Gaiellaceae bacterium]